MRDSFRNNDDGGRDESECAAAPANDGGMVAPAGLTRNETLVWRALREAGEPLKAYEILDRLKAKRVRAPMTVYRALEGLETKGLIHKLEALNAFIVCNRGRPHQLEVFVVCDDCRSVSEIEIDGLERLVKPAARRAQFVMDTARLEVRGRCGACAPAT